MRYACGNSGAIIKFLGRGGGALWMNLRLSVGGGWQRVGGGRWRILYYARFGGRQILVSCTKHYARSNGKTVQITKGPSEHHHGSLNALLTLGPFSFQVKDYRQDR